MQAEMEAFSNEAADDSRELMDQLAVENRERYDYRKFLQKFSVLKEKVQIDPDAFDYVFYNYGMQLYGNMPLIEPLETKEVRRIEDFVVVNDTSMSCSGELVKKFLEETYGVLNFPALIIWSTCRNAGRKSVPPMPWSSMWSM